MTVIAIGMIDTTDMNDMNLVDTRPDAVAAAVAIAIVTVIVADKRLLPSTRLTFLLFSPVVHTILV
jgi:hypothetical protein